LPRLKNKGIKEAVLRKSKEIEKQVLIISSTTSGVTKRNTGTLGRRSFKRYGS
jgi:hypothetical protein